MTLKVIMLFEGLLFFLLTGFYKICSLVGSGELERLKRLAPNFNRICCQVTEEVGAGQGVSFGVKMKKDRVMLEGHKVIIETKRRIPHPLLHGHYFFGSCLGSSRNSLCPQPCDLSKECLHFCCSSLLRMSVAGHMLGKCQL